MNLEPHDSPILRHFHQLENRHPPDGRIDGIRRLVPALTAGRIVASTGLRPDRHAGRSKIHFVTKVPDPHHHARTQDLTGRSRPVRSQRGKHLIDSERRPRRRNFNFGIVPEVGWGVAPNIAIPIEEAQLGVQRELERLGQSRAIETAIHAVVAQTAAVFLRRGDTGIDFVCAMLRKHALQLFGGLSRVSAVGESDSVAKPHFGERAYGEGDAKIPAGGSLLRAARAKDCD